MNQLDHPVAETVMLTMLRDGIAEVRLNRPEKLNALTEDMYARLAKIFDALHEDRAVRVVILTAEGRGFCAGSDVGGMLTSDGPGGRAKLQRRHAVVQALYKLEKPVIASVRGPIAGIGFSLAMACDLVVATDTAYFQQSFRNMGLVPDGGSIFFLCQRLGVGRAKDIVMTARKLGVQEAYTWGLVTEITSDAELEARTLSLAEELASAPTFTIGLAKKMFSAMSMPSLETALEIESFAASVARNSDDHREGVTAFREKRKPKFQGN